MPQNEGVEVDAAEACYLCGARGAILYDDLRDRLYAAPGTWAFLQCTACGHVWLNPRPLPGEVRKLYTTYYSHKAPAATPPGPKPGWRIAARRSLLSAFGYTDPPPSSLERFLGRLMYRIPQLREPMAISLNFVRGGRRGALLDVGCGSGQFLHDMQALGWTPTGIEPDSQAAGVARQQYGLEVVEGTVETADLPPDRFDAVTLSHVIEHVLDPVAALVRCRGWMKPDGVLVLRTPNLRSRGHAKFGKDWMHLDPPRHLHLFSPATLRQVADKAGLAVASVATVSEPAGEASFVSRTIRSAGRFDMMSPIGPLTRADRMFAFMETLENASQRDRGEEVVLHATKAAN